jgi:hypothetical protein
VSNRGKSRQGKNMSVSSLHWRENRVREEIYKQDLKQIDTSAHETDLPKSNGATFAPREQKPEVRPAENKKKNRRLRWIILPLATPSIFKLRTLHSAISLAELRLLRMKAPGFPAAISSVRSLRFHSPPGLPESSASAGICW